MQSMHVCKHGLDTGMHGPWTPALVREVVDTW